MRRGLIFLMGEGEVEGFEAEERIERIGWKARMPKIMRVRTCEERPRIIIVFPVLEEEPWDAIAAPALGWC